MARNHNRLVQSSTYLVQSNRANGDVSVLLYDQNPMMPRPDELRKVVGYIVDYASKANETEKQTKEAMKTLIMTEESTVGGKWDMSIVSVRGMNQLLQDRLTSKQETVCLMAGLKLFDCSRILYGIVFYFHII